MLMSMIEKFNKVSQKISTSKVDGITYFPRVRLPGVDTLVDVYEKNDDGKRVKTGETQVVKADPNLTCQDILDVMYSVHGEDFKQIMLKRCVTVLFSTGAKKILYNLHKDHPNASYTEIGEMLQEALDATWNKDLTFPVVRSSSAKVVKPKTDEERGAMIEQLSKESGLSVEELVALHLKAKEQAQAVPVVKEATGNVRKKVA